MTTANREWEFKGIDLTTVAYDVRALGAPEQVPERRGENLLIPGKTGRYSTLNKRLDERRLALAMFVDAQPAAGGARSGSQLWTNLDTLRSLFAQDGAGTLKHKHAAGTAGTTRWAIAEVSGMVEFAPEGPWSYAFVVEFSFADPFWYDETERTVGPVSITSSPQNITLVNTGTYRNEKARITLIGQIVDPKLTIDDVWMQYEGTVAEGGTLTIDCATWTATNGTADVSGDISHAGDLVWLPVPCGTAVTLTLTGSSISGYPSLTTVIREAYI